MGHKLSLYLTLAFFGPHTNVHKQKDTHTFKPSENLGPGQPIGHANLRLKARGALYFFPRRALTQSPGCHAQRPAQMQHTAGGGMVGGGMCVCGGEVVG